MTEKQAKRVLRFACRAGIAAEARSIGTVEGVLTGRWEVLLGHGLTCTENVREAFRECSRRS